MMNERAQSVLILDQHHPNAKLTKEQVIDVELWTACADGDVKTMVEILEKNNLSFNVKLEFEHTLLMYAAQQHQTELVNFLLDQPETDVSMETHLGDTALNFALHPWHNFENADYALAKKLIQAGANINQKTCHNNLLLRAWNQGNANAAENLILLGARIHISEKLFRSDPLRGHEVLNDIPHQIDLSKKYLRGLLKRVSEAERDETQVTASNPRPLTFKRDVENETRWQQWTQEYNERHPQYAKYGYGPGTMVCCEQ